MSISKNKDEILRINGTMNYQLESKTMSLVCSWWRRNIYPSKWLSFLKLKCLNKKSLAVLKRQQYYLFQKKRRLKTLQDLLRRRWRKLWSILRSRTRSWRWSWSFSRTRRPFCRTRSSSWGTWSTAWLRSVASRPCCSRGTAWTSRWDSLLTIILFLLCILPGAYWLALWRSLPLDYRG